MDSSLDLIVEYTKQYGDVEFSHGEVTVYYRDGKVEYAENLIKKLDKIHEIKCKTSPMKIYDTGEIVISDSASGAFEALLVARRDLYVKSVDLRNIFDPNVRTVVRLKNGLKSDIERLNSLLKDSNTKVLGLSDD